MRYHFAPVRIAKLRRKETTHVGEDVEKGEPSYTVGRDASWYSHFRKQCGGCQKVKIELPYDPAFALLGIYPKGTDVVKTRGICAPMFPATKSTIAQLWKEP